MTIPDITKALQKYKTLSLEDFNDIMHQLDIDSNRDGAVSILKHQDLRNTAFFVLAANNKTIKEMTTIKPNSVQFPYFLCSFLLAKICQNTTFDKDSINDIVTIITNLTPEKVTYNPYNYQDVSKKFPNSFSFDIGFTIGHCLSYGIDTTDLVKLNQPNIVTDDKKFITGLKTGFFTESKGLMFNDTYIKNLGTTWIKDTSHKGYIVKIYQKLTTTNTERNLNSINERTTWFLHTIFPNSHLICDLYEQHINVAKNKHEKTIHSPDLAAYFEQCLMQKSEQITKQIEQKFQLKLEKEVARIEQQAIDNAHTILEQQKLIKEQKEVEEKSLAFKQKLNKML